MQLKRTFLTKILGRIFLFLGFLLRGEMKLFCKYDFFSKDFQSKNFIKKKKNLGKKKSIDETKCVFCEIKGEFKTHIKEEKPQNSKYIDDLLLFSFSFFLLLLRKLPPKNFAKNLH